MKGLIWVIALVLVFSLNFSTKIQANDEALLGSDFNLDVSGAIRTRLRVLNGEETVQLSKSFVKLSADWQQKIRAVITTKLDRVLRQSGSAVATEMDVGNFVKDAYIEIRNIAGIPVAVVVGKQAVAFGNAMTHMPQFNESPLWGLQNKTEVFAVTVKLETGILGLFDKAEVSIFELEGGDFEIGRVNGASLRISKELTKQWFLRLSAMHMGDEDMVDEGEDRASVGLVYKSKDNSFVGWIEGIVFSNNPSYPDSNVAITAGGLLKVTKGVNVVAEYSYIQDSIQEIGVGTRVMLTQNVSAGAEVRYRDDMNNDDNDGFIFGADVTVIFGTTKKDRYRSYLFED